MADKTLFTRIINKNDSLAKWTANDPVLKQGEIALAYIETTTAGGNIVPTYLMKVGHGNKKFSELKWLAAPASDVFAWAKKENITDNEEISNVIAQASTNKVAIEGLDGRIDVLEAAVGQGGSVAEAIQAAIEALDVTDTAVAGQFVTAVSEADGKIAVTRAALKASDIPTLGLDKIDGLVARFEAVEGDVATIKSNIGNGTVDSRIATAKSEAIEAAAGDATSKANTAKSEAIAAAATDATGKANTAEENAKKYAKDYADGLAGNYDAAGDAAAAEANAKAYADGLAKNYDAAGAAATAEENAKKYTDDELAAVVEQYLTGEGAKDTIDTLNEIAQWLVDDEAGAAKIVADVAKNAGDIATEAGARAGADTALGNRITELEKVDHDHSNKAVLDGITETKVNNWDDANAKKHEHSNKAELDKIADGDVAKWNAAEQNAKNYADGEIATAKQEAIDAAGLAADGKIQALDVTVSGMGAGKTIATLTETDGKIAATFQDIKITKSQVTDFKDSDYDAAGAATAAETNAKTYAKNYTDAEVKKVSNKVDALTTDDIAAGTEVWIFDCGTSSTVI